MYMFRRHLSMCICKVFIPNSLKVHLLSSSEGRKSFIFGTTVNGYITLISLHCLLKSQKFCMLPYFYACLILHAYTLTDHFIRYTLLVPGWTPLCLQNCFNYSWHRFNKVLETFLRDFGPYWYDSITRLLQICRLHIHDANLPFHHIPKVLYWIEIWWLWRPFE